MIEPQRTQRAQSQRRERNNSDVNGFDITCPRCTFDALSVDHSGAVGIEITDDF